MKSIGDIVKDVEEGITGRVANYIGGERTNSIEVLLGYVLKAGGGNHLEIGTLFGGSAIPVAMLKYEYGHSGIVVCVDPLDGYYGVGRKDSSGVEVSPTTLFENIDEFEVGYRIAVIKDISSVVCRMFTDIKFSTAYIDGEHKDNMPLNDWNKVKNLVTKYVIFDNYSDAHPNVMLACFMAGREYGWEEVYASGNVYVVKRV